jgi:hypothetical protein
MRYTDLFEVGSPRSKTAKSVKNSAKLFAEPNIDISQQNLSSLKGCPEQVAGNFKCSFNELTSLVGGPKIVGGDFDVSYNYKLRSFEGMPQVHGSINISNCDFHKLENMPDVVNGNFSMGQTWNIDSLHGCPSRVTGYAYLTMPHSGDLSGAPRFIGDNLMMVIPATLRNASFSGIQNHLPEIHGVMTIRAGEVPTHLLGLCMIKGLTDFNFQYHNMQKRAPEFIDIIRKYIGQGRKGMMLAQAELVQAGFEKYAQL